MRVRIYLSGGPYDGIFLDLSGLAALDDIPNRMSWRDSVYAIAYKDGRVMRTVDGAVVYDWQDGS